MRNIPKLVFIYLCLLLVPYLFLGAFSYASADDFTYAMVTLQRGFWAAQSYWYNAWSGRYVSTALLSLNPLIEAEFSPTIHSYKLIGLLTLILLFLVSFWFFRLVFKNILKRWELFIVYLAFVAILVSELPSIVEGFYWLSGVVNYSWAFVVFLFGVNIFLHYRNWGFAKPQRDEKSWIVKFLVSFFLAILSLVLGGFNETLVFIWIFLILSAEAYTVTMERKFDKVLVLPLIASGFSLWLVIKAPGNAVRAAQFSNNKNILSTVFGSVGLGLEIFVRYLKPALVMGLVLTIPRLLSLREKVSEKFYSREMRWFFIFLFASILFLYLAPARWAMGGGPPRRALNILCVIHVFFSCLIFFQTTWAYQQKFKRFSNSCAGYVPFKTSLIVLGILLFVGGNHWVAWRDLLFLAAPYAEQNERRLADYQRHPHQDVLVDAFVQPPPTLFFDDIIEDSKDWRNTSVAEYYSLNSVRIRNTAERSQ